MFRNISTKVTALRAGAGARGIARIKAPEGCRSPRRCAVTWNLADRASVGSARSPEKKFAAETTKAVPFSCSLCISW